MRRALQNERSMHSSEGGGGQLLYWIENQCQQVKGTHEKIT